jgi:hypothetical protein
LVRHGRPGGPTYQVSDRRGGLLAGDTDHGWPLARIIEWARALPDSDDSYHWTSVVSAAGVLACPSGFAAPRSAVLLTQGPLGLVRYRSAPPCC